MSRPLPQIPQYAVPVDTFDELGHMARQFAAGHFNLIGVIGNAGLRKSRTFIEALQAANVSFCQIKGDVRPFILYQQLWQHRNEFIVIDDADSLFAQRSSIPILKCLLETETPKVVSWQSRAIDDEEIPRSFTTASKVVILCNEWRTLNYNMIAVQDRGIFLHFVPSVFEVHKKMVAADWFKDEEILEFVGMHLPLITEPSMRHYLRAAELRNAGVDDWQGKTLRMVNRNAKRIVVVSRLLDDITIMSEDERVTRFVEETGSSPATYYRDRELLRRARAVSTAA